MSEKTSRLLAVLELLQANGTLSASDFTRLLGVHERTLRRDIAALEAMGIPLTTERGRHGGYSLVAGYRVPPLMFSPEEAQAVCIGLVAAKALGLATPETAATSALAKLERVLPSTVQQRVRAMSSIMTIERPRADATPAASDTLATISTAAQLARTVEFDYLSPGQPSHTRRLDTWGLAWRGAHWYAVGWCHLRTAVRSFRVDRLSNVRQLDTTFDRPTDFDALAFLTRQLATLPRKWHLEVILHTELAKAQRVVAPAYGVLSVASRGVRFVAEADDLDWFARELARLPFSFDIVSPSALRKHVRAVARQLLKSV